MEGSRRLLRSQPRRLGLGLLARRDPSEAVPTYHEGAKLTLQTGTFYLAGNRNFLLGSDTLRLFQCGMSLEEGFDSNAG
jgi:hypothetical protein